jgi:transcriptional regulator with XRE-family HTH domain
MTTENELKTNVSENLIFYRKANNLTQLQLAEKLNYSDKSISKWERGESLPDLFVLQSIADLFGITLNDLAQNKPHKKPKHRISRLLISLMYFGLVWLIATIAFVVLGMLDIPGVSSAAWLSFIYAIPVSMIVLLVFTLLWGKKIHTFLTLTVLYWSIPLAFYLSFDYGKIWMLFIVIIPLQILTIIWFILKKEISVRQ